MSYNVDWTGNLINRSSMVFNSIPLVKLNSPTFNLLEKWIEILKKNLVPGDPKEILFYLSKLRLHFFGGRIGEFSEQEIEALIEDYIKDLSSFPIDLIELVCDEYRLDANSEYFPHIGKLRTKVMEYFEIRIIKLNRLQALYETSCKQGA